MEGELQEVYARACACVTKEVELVVACFVYRVRHSEQVQVKVSKDVLSALEAAGCAACKKVSGCSLGMFLCHQQQQSTAQRPPETNEERDYFGDWGKGLGSFEGQGSYGGFIEKVVAELQARHEQRTQGGTRHQNKKLSLRKLYSVFGKVCAPTLFAVVTYFPLVDWTKQEQRFCCYPTTFLGILSASSSRRFIGHTFR